MLSKPFTGGKIRRFREEAGLSQMELAGKGGNDAAFTMARGFRYSLNVDEICPSPVDTVAIINARRFQKLEKTLQGIRPLNKSCQICKAKIPPLKEPERADTVTR